MAFRMKIGIVILPVVLFFSVSCVPSDRVVDPADLITPTLGPTFTYKEEPIESDPTPMSTPNSTPDDDDFPIVDPNSYLPQPGDENLTRGNVFIDSLALVENTKTPLLLKLSLPTPCHIARVQISKPTADNTIDISAYSLVDPNIMCAQVVTSQEILLPLNPLDEGNYKIDVNGKEMLSFDWPQ